MCSAARAPVVMETTLRPLRYYKTAESALEKTPSYGRKKRGTLVCSLPSKPNHQLWYEARRKLEEHESCVIVAKDVAVNNYNFISGGHNNFYQ